MAIRVSNNFVDGYKPKPKILYNAVLSVAKKDMKKAKKLPEGAERDNKIKGAMFLKRILESNSIITMSMSAGTNCPYNFAQGFVSLANGHFIKGIKCFCTKIKVPKLPKEKDAHCKMKLRILQRATLKNRSYPSAYNKTVS